MLKNNPLLDDIAKLAGGAAGSMLELRKEVESMVKAKVDQCAADAGFVTREEYEVLEARLNRLQEQFEELSSKAEG